jgi:hypothetical protein
MSGASTSRIERKAEATINISRGFLPRYTTQPISGGNGTIVYTAPSPGDLIYYSTNGGVKIYHVGIVRDYNPNTKTVYTIEGNTEMGKVWTQEYRVDLTNKIYGYSQTW